MNNAATLAPLIETERAAPCPEVRQTNSYRAQQLTTAAPAPLNKDNKQACTNSASRQLQQGHFSSGRLSRPDKWAR